MIKVFNKLLPAQLALALAMGVAGAGAQGIVLDDQQVEETTVEQRRAPARESVSDAAVAAAREANRAAAKAVRREPRRKAAAVAKAPRTAPAHFVLRDIVFTPSAYLSADELAEAEAELVGKRYRADRLDTVIERIAQIYARHNIALAQPLLAGVDPATGTVRIELFEARLGAVRFKSANASEAYYRWRLGVKEGDLADNRLCLVSVGSG